MPFRLNQKSIVEMTIGTGGGGAGGGGGSFDPSMLAGYATQAWVNENYLSIEFFSKLFKAYDSAATPNEIKPNDTESTITNIKAMFGFWTQQYISALGKNSSGGGGGSSTLADLLDVAISSPTNGQVLMYNASTNKWYNGTVQQGSSDWNSISNKPTTIAGYGITDAKITNGTITLGSNSITPLTSSAISDMATKTWVGQQGYLTSSAISDMATKTWVGQQGFITSVSGTFWGKSWSNGGTVSGNLYAGSNGGAIEGFHSIELNSEGSLSGYGGFIDFHYNGSSADFTSRIIEDASGRLYLNASNGVRIGNGVLKWDSTNNAFKVEKFDGTSANLYATGGVSALGMSAGVTSIDAMTFGYLKVNDQLVFGNNQALMYKDDYLYIECSDTISVNTVEFDYSGNVYTNGNVRAERFYLDSNRYLYVSGGTLYYYNGSESKQIAFIN